jgi:hypothetical protein
MMEATHTSETSVENYFTRQYIPEDKSELHARRREKLKSQTLCGSYKRRFRRKYPGVRVPDSSTSLRLLKEVRSTANYSILDKKYATQNAMLTEEMLHKTETTLRHSPCKPGTIMKFRFVFWDVLQCIIIVDRRFRGTCCLHNQGPVDGGSTYL